MTDHYVLFGNPLSHTRSPAIHRTFAEQFGEDISYEAREIPEGSYPEALRDFIAAGGAGANVTSPFKKLAVQNADHVLDAAQAAGAANCLKIVGGKVHAQNFDGIGLTRDITTNIGVPMRGKRVLLLGAGGAACGAALPFLNERPSALVIANRTRAHAEDIRDRLADFGSIKAIGYEEIVEGYDIVLDATSCALQGIAPPVPQLAFEGCQLAYGLAYGKGVTPFMARALAQGVSTVDGVGMVVEQAAEAFEWWRGQRPQTGQMIDDLRKSLS